MNKSTKKVIATALQNIATALHAESDAMPNPLETLFDYGDTPATSEPTNEDILNNYFHETVGKSTRTLNHSLNKVNKDWEMKNIRTPKGPRALVEVAIDCNLDPKEMCNMILVHPKFSGNAIGNAARNLLTELG